MTKHRRRTGNRSTEKENMTARENRKRTGNRTETKNMTARENGQGTGQRHRIWQQEKTDCKQNRNIQRYQTDIARPNRHMERTRTQTQNRTAWPKKHRERIETQAWIRTARANTPDKIERKEGGKYLTQTDGIDVHPAQTDKHATETCNIHEINNTVWQSNNSQTDRQTGRRRDRQPDGQTHVRWKGIVYSRKGWT